MMGLTVIFVWVPAPEKNAKAVGGIAEVTMVLHNLKESGRSDGSAGERRPEYQGPDLGTLD